MRPPVAADEAYDTPGSVLTAVVVTGPQYGSLTLAADGGFGYTPDPDFADSDTFTYVANDGFGDSNTATVTITVEEVIP